MLPVNPRKIGEIVIAAVAALVVLFIIVMLVFNVMSKPQPLDNNAIGALSANATAKN